MKKERIPSWVREPALWRACKFLTSKKGFQAVKKYVEDYKKKKKES